MTLTTAFLGTRAVGYRCLEHLLDRSGDLGLVVTEVVTRMPENTALTGGMDLAVLARSRGIPVAADFDPDGPDVDLLFSVQHEHVLTPAQLARARRCAINLHMAPLPAYRGTGQFSHAVLNGAETFGTTLHEMIPAVDAGPILAQRLFPVLSHWTVEDLYRHTVEESITLFGETLDALVTDTLTPRPQLPTGQPAYRRSDLTVLKKIDLTWPPDRIARTVRAFDMPGYEPAYIDIDGQRIYMRLRSA